MSRERRKLLLSVYQLYYISTHVVKLQHSSRRRAVFGQYTGEVTTSSKDQQQAGVGFSAMSGTPGPTVAGRTQGLSTFIVFDVHSPPTPLGRHENGVSSFSPYTSYTILQDYQAKGRSLLSDIAASAPTGQWITKFIYLRKSSHPIWVLQLVVHSYIRIVFMPLVSDTRGLVRGQLTYLY